MNSGYTDSFYHNCAIRVEYSHIHTLASRYHHPDRFTQNAQTTSEMVYGPEI